jgi:peptidoglycan/LPS O-acetylase OafA/YrhL
MNGRLGHRPALDGLRGIAILLVIGIHAYSWPKDGLLGVDLFFLLSGFLITALLVEERSRNGRVSLAGFYARRARRLMPALLAFLLVFTTVAAVDRDGRAAVSSLLGLGFATNVALAWNLVPISQGTEHLWSLATEDQFYFLWPVLLFVALRGRRAYGAVLLLVVLAAMAFEAERATGANGEFGPDVRPIGLVIGCLVALAWTGRARSWLRLVAIALFPICTLLALRLILAPDGRGTITVFDLAAAFVLVGALEIRWFARLLSCRPLVWLGAISYSLYLWHLPILLWTGAEGRPVPATFAVVASVAVAALSYRLIEQPFRRRRSARIAPSFPAAAAELS